jgi:serine/threonine protein kinase
MLMQIRCPNPNCGRPSRLGDDDLGRIFRCPRCQTRFPHESAADRRGWADSSQPLRPDIGTTRGLIGEVADRNADSWDGGLTPLPRVPDGDGVRIDRVGRFRLRETLGSGTFATVYRAFDPFLGLDVALKVLRSDFTAVPRSLDRFLHEAKVLARLRHPRIVTLHEAGCHGLKNYMSTSYIPGQTLARVLEEGPLDPWVAAGVAFGVAEALAHAHSRGVVHRDVKPANLLLDRRGAAYLMDFGLAHRRGAEGPRTSDESIVGTPAYMAPEQARGGASTPLPANDQYSLGVVLYEALCGQPPFSGPPPLMLFRTIHEEPIRPCALRPDVPPALEAICLRAMAKRPEDRFASCRELADELGRWAFLEPIEAGRGIENRPPLLRASVW